MTVTSYNNSHDNPNNHIYDCDQFIIIHMIIPIILYMTVTSYNNSDDNPNNPIYDCD